MEALKEKVHLIPEPAKSHFLHRKKMEEAMQELRARTVEVWGGDECSPGMAAYDNLDGVDSADVFVPLDDVISGGIQDESDDTGNEEISASMPLPEEIKIAGERIYNQVKTFTERLHQEFTDGLTTLHINGRQYSDTFILSPSDKRQIKVDSELLSCSKKQTAAYFLVQDYAHRHVVEEESCQLGLLVLGGAGI